MTFVARAIDPRAFCKNSKIWLYAFMAGAGIQGGVVLDGQSIV
jgi:hypothetical protein